MSVTTSHCVPVVISNKIELPFETSIDYSHFTLFVSHEPLHSLSPPTSPLPPLPQDALRQGYLLRLLHTFNEPSSPVNFPPLPPPFTCLPQDALRQGYLLRLLRTFPRERWLQMWQTLQQVKHHFEFQAGIPLSGGRVCSFPRERWLRMWQNLQHVKHHLEFQVGFLVEAILLQPSSPSSPLPCIEVFFEAPQNTPRCTRVPGGDALSMVQRLSPHPVPIIQKARFPTLLSSPPSPLPLLPLVPLLPLLPPFPPLPLLLPLPLIPQYPSQPGDAVSMVWREIRKKLPRVRLAIHRGKRLVVRDWTNV
ncbi:unnamed protein product [Closterium sp. NIES-53]